MELEEERLINLIKKRKPKALEKVMDLYMNSVCGMAKVILLSVGIMFLRLFGLELLL